jgi:hypothetical protein
MRNLPLALFALTVSAFSLSAAAQQKPATKPTVLPKQTLAESIGVQNPRPVIDKAPSEVKKPVEVSGESQPAPVAAATAAPVVSPSPIPSPTPSAKPAAAPKPAPVAKTAAKTPATKATPAAKPVAAAAPSPSPTPVADADGVTETRLLVTTSALSAETEPTDAKTRNSVIADTKGDAVKEASFRRPRFPRESDDRPGVNLAFGYVHSRWKDFSGALKNGSLEMRVAFMREFWTGVETEFGFSALFLNSASSNGENGNGAFAVDLGARWLPWNSDDTPVLPYAGLHASFGGYRVWSVLAENANLVTYQKHGAGTLAGLTPSLGVRFEASPRVAFDVEANYRGYFDNPAFKTGGWGALVRVGLKR